tara:strand:+ start:7037 stop:7537 length:501 start_codon:yes stop_codon:yes gene_type:complete
MLQKVDTEFKTKVKDNSKEVEALQNVLELFKKSNQVEKHLETLEQLQQDLLEEEFQKNFEWSDTTRQRLVKAFKFLRKKENGGWWCNLLADWSNDKHAKVMRSGQNQVWFDHQEKDRLKDWNMGFFQFNGSVEFLFNTFKKFDLEVEWDKGEDSGLVLKLPRHEDW